MSCRRRRRRRSRRRRRRRHRCHRRCCRCPSRCVSQLRHRQRVADRGQLAAQLVALGLRRQQSRGACLRRSRFRQRLLLPPLFRALLFAPRHPRRVLRRALRRRSLLNCRDLRRPRQRAAHRGVRVRAQRRAFRHSMLRRSAFQASRESSVRPARIDLKDPRPSWADELNHRVQIRFGWHACGPRSGRHRGERHRWSW